MGKLTKEQIEECEKKITANFGGLELICDGFNIKLSEYRSGQKIRVACFVNGEIKGTWFMSSSNSPERLFYKDCKKSLKHQTYCKKNGIPPPKLWKQHDFASGKDALRHLNKVCENIEVVS